MFCVCVQCGFVFDIYLYVATGITTDVGDMFVCLCSCLSYTFATRYSNNSVIQDFIGVKITLHPPRVCLEKIMFDGELASSSFRHLLIGCREKFQYTHLHISTAYFDPSSSIVRERDRLCEYNGYSIITYWFHFWSNTISRNMLVIRFTLQMTRAKCTRDEQFDWKVI